MRDRQQFSRGFKPLVILDLAVLVVLINLSQPLDLFGKTLRRDVPRNLFGDEVMHNRRSEEHSLRIDLVEVAPQAQPPVCRIVDFGKYQYEQKKRAHEAKKKQVVIEVKEIKFRPATDEHDYNFKMKHAREILGDGNKVKATVRFRGREITHKELGMQLLDRLEKDLAENGSVEFRPRQEGMQITVVFTPKKEK